MACSLVGAKPLGLSEPALLIGTFGTNFSEILIATDISSLKKMPLEYEFGN